MAGTTNNLILENESRKRSSKIEKSFFAKSNFELLASVLSDTSKRSLPDDYKNILFSEMSRAFQRTGNPKGLNKSERYTYVQQLNKAVLANVFKIINKPINSKEITDLPANGRANTGRPLNNSIPSNNPAISAGQNSHQMGWGDVSNTLATFPPGKSSDFYPFLPQLSKREMVMPSRQFSHHDLVPAKPNLSPSQDFQEFPTPPQATRISSDIQPSQWQAVSASRTQEPKVSLRTNRMQEKEYNTKDRQSTSSALTRIENERAELFRKENPKVIDFALPKVKEEDDSNPEDRLQQMMLERKKDDQQLISNEQDEQEVVRSPPNDANVQKSKVFMQKKRMQESERSSEHQDHQGLYDRREQSMYKDNNNINSIYQNNADSTYSDHPPFTQDNFVNGLDEDLLMADNVKDSPISTFGKQSYQELPQAISYTKGNDTLRGPNFIGTLEPETSGFAGGDTRDIYLTIHSKYRDYSIYPSPYEFKLNTEESNEETIDVIEDDQLLFRETKQAKDAELNFDDLQDIMVVECLDVSVPKSLVEVFEEPYLWLCIDEWGAANIGTGVPKGAFARLKPIPSNSDSRFVTMRAHVLERHVLKNQVVRSLTFRLLRADGEPIQQTDHLLLKDSHKMDKNSWVYLRSFYPDKSQMTCFQNNVYIYSLKFSKKQELSFKMYVDKSDEDKKENKQSHTNKIGSYRGKKIKHTLSVNKYLSKGDLFFLQIPENQYIYCPILDISADTITIKFDKIPKTINRIGFLRKDMRGYSSDNKDHICYKGGTKLQTVLDTILPYSQEDYLVIRREEQVSYMFRLLQKV